MAAPTVSLTFYIATRKRVALLTNFLRSLERHADAPERISCYLYVDDDDLETQAFVQSPACQQFRLRLQAHVGPRTGSNGVMYNQLYQLYPPQEGLVCAFPDDYQVTTPGWDRLMDEVRERFPDEIFMGYFDANTMDPDAVVLQAFGQRWLQITGGLFTDHFPYWFDDTWVGDVGELVQRKVPLGIRALPQERDYQTQRLVRSAFWIRYYYHLLDERVAQAELLRSHISDGAVNTSAQLIHRDRLKRRWARRNRSLDLVKTVYESEGAGGEVEPSEKYLRLELRALRRLYQRALDEARAGQTGAVRRLLADAELAYQRCSGFAALGAAVDWYAGKFCPPVADDPALAALQPWLRCSVTAESWHRALDVLAGHEPSPTGVTPDIVRRIRGPLQRLRLRLMPWTYRFYVMGSTAAKHPPWRWPYLVRRWLQVRRFLRALPVKTG